MGDDVLVLVVMHIFFVWFIAVYITSRTHPRFLSLLFGGTKPTATYNLLMEERAGLFCLPCNLSESILKSILVKID